MTDEDEEFDRGDEEDIEEAFHRMKDAYQVEYPKGLKDGTRDAFKAQAHQAAKDAEKPEESEEPKEPGKKEGCGKKAAEFVLLFITIVSLFFQNG